MFEKKEQQTINWTSDDLDNQYIHASSGPSQWLKWLSLRKWHILSACDWYVSIVCLNDVSTFPEGTMSRWFPKQTGIRQNATVIETGGINSVRECSFICISNAEDCMGFNVKQGPPAMCELSRVHYDAPNTDMVDSTAWDHYAIVHE